MRVAVIGAGPSGLTTCKTLREAGLDETCLEAGSRVGGEFVDGSLEPVDAIMWATGYRFSLPFLTAEVLGVRDPSDLRLYQGIAHTRHPRLFFVGVLRALCSIWPYSEQQARWIAANLAGRFSLPAAAELERAARPILRGPLQHCQFLALDLQREARLRR